MLAKKIADILQNGLIRPAGRTATCVATTSWEKQKQIRTINTVSNEIGRLCEFPGAEISRIDHWKLWKQLKRGIERMHHWFVNGNTDARTRKRLADLNATKVKPNPGPRVRNSLYHSRITPPGSTFTTPGGRPNQWTKKQMFTRLKSNS